jgi:hypothetical protein
MRDSENRRADRVETVHQESIDRNGVNHKTIVSLCTKVDSQRDEISALQNSISEFKTNQSAILRELREIKMKPAPLPQPRHDYGYQSAAVTPERKSAAPPPERKDKDQARGTRSYNPYTKPPQRAAPAQPESPVLCHSVAPSTSGGTQSQKWPDKTRPFAQPRQSWKPAPKPVQSRQSSAELDDFSIFEDNFESVAVKQVRSCNLALKRCPSDPPDLVCHLHERLSLCDAFAGHAGAPDLGI